MPCKYLFLELLLSEPRIRHVLLHVVVVLVVLVVALRPRPERHQERRVASVPHERVDPRVVTERCVAAVVAFFVRGCLLQSWRRRERRTGARKNKQKQRGTRVSVSWPAVVGISQPTHLLRVLHSTNKDNQHSSCCCSERATSDIVVERAFAPLAITMIVSNSG